MIKLLARFMDRRVLVLALSKNDIARLTSMRGIAIKLDVDFLMKAADIKGERVQDVMLVAAEDEYDCLAQLDEMFPVVDNTGTRQEET